MTARSGAAAGGTAFDAGWYVSRHGDVPSLIERGWFVDPLHHYVMAGCREGRSPNAEFREDYYRSIYPDIEKAIQDNVFSCGFEHYLRHGRAEGRRARPAVRGALVDLTRYRGGRLHDRILLSLSMAFERLGDWDFWLLTREASHDGLAHLDGVNVVRLCVDRIIGDASERWKDLPIRTFLAPFGASEYYGPAFHTVTILPDLARDGRRAADIELALAISDAVLCLTLSDRSELTRRWQVERDRIGLLHLPPSRRIAAGPHPPSALGSIAGRRFILTDLSGAGASTAVALHTLDALSAMPDTALLVAAAGPDAAAELRAAAARAGAAGPLVLVEAPTSAVWQWLLDNCAAVLETGRLAVTPGIIEDALALGRPLVCSRQSIGLRTAAGLVSAFDPDEPSSIAAACRLVLADPVGAGEAAGEAIRRAFPALGDEAAADFLATMLRRGDRSARSAGPQREVLLGLRDGNRVHATFWFGLPPSAAARSLILELAVPIDFPEPAVLVTVLITGQPEVREIIERGRSARLAVAMPPRRVEGRGVVHARRADGTILKMQPQWPGLELRSATVLASGLDLLQSAGGGPDAGAPMAAATDTDLVVGAINAAIDAAAPALTTLEATLGPALAAKPALRRMLPRLPAILRAAAPVALHLTRHQFLQPDLRFHGSNKDQAARQQYLRDRGFRVVTEPAHDWKYEGLKERLSAERHSEPQVIILEAMLHHPLLRYLRERFPKAKLLVRSHNAEILHRLHTHTAALKLERGSALAWLDPREAVARAGNVVSHWRYDAGSIDLADHILSITEWETERYWPYLGPRSKVSTVPYFLPRDLVQAGPVPVDKPHRCVCLTSASPGPIIYDALRTFVRLVEGLDDPAGWDFPVTGGLEERYVPRSTRCRFLGRVENPIELLGRATSMALLSPYGYGFKTKILDAICARSYTLLPQSLLDRHPAEVRPYCVAVDLASPASFKAALERTLEPIPDGDPNEALRAKAYAAMDAVLGF